MNTAHSSATPVTPPPLATGLPLWLRQVLAIFRIEFSKALISKRAIPCYALVTFPVTLFLYAILDSMGPGGGAPFGEISEARRVFANIFSTLILGAVIYLGSAAIFTVLFRGEVLDRSIHYYLLAPVRREVLVAGKFLAGYAAAFVLFAGCTVTCFLLMYLQFGVGQLLTDLSNGIALTQLGQYLGITALAILGYGSLFMAAGLLLRNPLIPIVLIALWEMIHFILPPALKVFSVIYYLKGLLPIPLDEGPLAIIVAPPPLWVSVVGMVLLSAAMLAGSVILLKKSEVKYTDE